LSGQVSADFLSQLLRIMKVYFCVSRKNESPPRCHPIFCPVKSRSGVTRFFVRSKVGQVSPDFLSRLLRITKVYLCVSHKNESPPRCHPLFFTRIVRITKVYLNTLSSFVWIIVLEVLPGVTRCHPLKSMF
jgi:hypothetical protein